MSSVMLNIDLVKIAVDIERKGTAFYDVMARSTDEAQVRDTFLYLAGMERRHIQIFQGMVSDMDKTPPIGLEAEYTAYIKALRDNSVFGDEFVNSELVNQVKDTVQALELSLIAEKDSLIFYYELREQITGPSAELLNRIIIEEKAHIKQLSEIKKKIKAGDKNYGNEENPEGGKNGGANDSQ